MRENKAVSRESPRQRTLLILTQVYVPDPASVGQHMADAAAEMVRRGWRVVVLTARRGYDDPTVKYAARETIAGVEVRRLPLSSFGKKIFMLRILAAVLFMVQTVWRGIFTRRVECLLVSTSPPMCLLAALAIGSVRRAPIKFWVMDLNPDQLVALDQISPTSLPARAMDWFNRWILRRSSDIIALDRFMAERLNAKLDVSDKLTVLPPWPHEDHVEPIAHGENPFRKKYNLEGKIVFMYSGNHGIALPLATFLEAAVQFKDDTRAMFVFIGGGARKVEVTDTISKHHLTNMISLPYQPMSELRYSLSAGDVHLISIGDRMVGVIHPCKLYGAMAAARPLLLLGPRPCHASEIIERHEIGWRIVHGDVAGAVATIRTILSTSPQKLAEIGRRAQRIVSTQLSKDILCGKFCDVLEGEVNTTHASAV